MFRKYIKNKLQNYRISLNLPDKSLPLRIRHPRKIAVIGGGIAGISAASNLAERGFDVELFEKESFLGGRISSRQFESNGETLTATTGLHAFYKQYFNLRRYLNKIGASKHLIAVSDYTLLYDKNKRQGFKTLDKTPGYNMLGLRTFKMIEWKMLLSPKGFPFLNLLMFDFATTFKEHDNESFASFARRTKMTSKMQLVLNIFARSFFTDLEELSLAEFIKGLHFYLLSNAEGLLFDVLDNDFQTSFISYCEQFMQSYQVKINYSTPVTALEKTHRGFLVNGYAFDYCILSTDINSTGKLIQQAKGFEAYTHTLGQIASLKNSGRYAVLRIWTDKFENAKATSSVVFTERAKCLDLVALLHKIEKPCTQWSREHKGGVFELHSYNLPADLVDDEAIKAQLIKEAIHYFPELEGMRIIHQHFQLRNDAAGLQVNKYNDRPEIKTDIPGLFLAGDWVKMNNCSMLMEAAYTSGSQAANFIFEAEDMQQNEVKSVPMKGILL